ncbi:5-formyltetrahydrofolate cyclo-ligase [Amycolatopsis sp.]|uniref:5-formyltetrahydrofolate cyclo-ligase n=1 Tax=Amycolatopsis sp. TaxID=37632 RepID=UPI002E0731E1|nr:5-formyltetrahydrofolate cyclo-ligase [Amycolatopsis sp.]
MHGSGNELSSKAEWRAWLSAERASTTPEQRAEEALKLAEAASGLPRGVVCGYVPFGDEPGSLALLDALRARGSRVLLPVIAPVAGPLDWAEYTGPETLIPGRLRGILEPSGARLGVTAVKGADLVLLPALAVDHGGVRLGRGAGHYDRSLVFASPGTELVAVVRDSEFVDQLPVQSHDVPMTGALTPGQGLVRLPV